MISEYGFSISFRTVQYWSLELVYNFHSRFFRNFRIKIVFIICHEKNIKIGFEILFAIIQYISNTLYI